MCTLVAAQLQLFSLLDTMIFIISSVLFLLSLCSLSEIFSIQREMNHRKSTMMMLNVETNFNDLLSSDDASNEKCFEFVSSFHHCMGATNIPLNLKALL